MKVGVMLPTMQSVEINEAMAQAAVGIGVDSLWMPDHLLGITHPDLWKEFAASQMIADPDAWLDPFCLSAALGRQINLPLGTCVTDGTRRRGADLARTVLTLNQGCRGGFILGIGAGEAESCTPFGYDFSKPVGKLEKTLKDLRSLLDSGRMPDGGIGRRGLSLEGPNGPPQVWVAGARDRSLGLAARYGDGWLPTGVSVEEYAEKRAWLLHNAAAAGRAKPVCAYFPLILLGDSRASVAAALEKQPMARLTLLFAPASLWRKHGFEHPSGPDCRGTPDAIPHALDPALLRRLAQEIPLAMIEDFMIIGNAKDIAERLRPYAAAGVEHMVLADFTGITYEPAETARLMGQLQRLTQLLHEMPVSTH